MIAFADRAKSSTTRSLGIRREPLEHLPLTACLQARMECPCFPPMSFPLPNTLLRFLAVMMLGGLPAMAATPEFMTRVWQSEEGLPGNAVRSVAQSADGYLWVATAEGVARFDGVSFSGFPESAPSSLARLAARYIIPFADGSICISTESAGLLRWDGRSLIRILDDQRQANVHDVSQVIQGDGGSLWIVRGAETWHWTATHGAMPAKPDTAIQAKLDEDRVRWSERGRYLPGVTEMKLIDRHGRLWSSGTASGLTVTLAGGGQTIDVLKDDNGIAELAEDREGNIWAALQTGGLVRIRDRRVSILRPGVGPTAPTSVIQDHSGVWWIGDRSGGIDRIEKGLVTHHVTVADSLEQRAISVLFEDQAGRFYAATRDGSLFIWNGGKFLSVKQTGTTPIAKVDAIADDGDGGLWLGGVNGLIRWKDQLLEKFDASKGLPGKPSAMLLGEGKTLWIGTSEGQLVRFDGRTFSTESAVTPLAAGRRISGIASGKNGDLWVSTLGSGLLHRDAKGRWWRYGTSEGLPDPRITAAIEDQRGDLWLGSLGGIFRAKRDDLGKPGFVPWLRLDRSDGLNTRECFGGAHPAAWRSKDGSLWFPTTRGLAKLHPENILLNEVSPEVILESVKTSNGEISNPNGLVSAGPGRERLEIHFTAPSFSAPEKVSFRVKLDGLDDKWRELGTNRSVSYEAVPPGNYTFQVTATNGDGVTSARPASLELEIKPNWWQTPWFLTAVSIAAIAFAVAAGWLISRRRLKRRIAALKDRNAREAERSRIARDLHDDLGASLTEISLLAAISAETVPEGESRESLEEIAEKAQHLVGSLDEIVWAVDPRHDSSGSIVEYIASTGQEFLARAGIFLRFDLTREIPDVEIEPERRHALFLAVRESFNNIVKHSGAKLARLSVSFTDDILIILVEDHGVGFDFKDIQRGDGLANLGKRMEACQGTVSITSAHGSGCRIELRMPLRSSQDRRLPTHPTP